MTKEDMKNKYSAFITEISETLGLGKPVDILKLCATTDLFFQPLEKRIADLEKENAELRAKYLQATDEGTSWAHLKSLEKENAELKAELSENKVADCHIVNGLCEQLTKAKEIINEFLDFESSCMERGIYISDKIRTEAKQFLSEVEK